MADDDTQARPADVPARIEAPMIFVKGGTTTAAHDQLMAKQRHDTEQRRAVQDRQYQITQQDPMGARMHSMKLGGENRPQVVLAIKHPKDNVFLEWIVCEIIDQGDQMILYIACPTCRAKNPGHDPDIAIAQKNRMWWLDPQPPKWMRDLGADRIWVNPVDGSTVVVAGSVTSQDWMPCGRCSWVFKFDDSVVYSK